MQAKEKKSLQCSSLDTDKHLNASEYECDKEGSQAIQATTLDRGWQRKHKPEDERARPSLRRLTSAQGRRRQRGHE